MREAGQSYSEISLKLGIPKNTIKSHCRRNNIIVKEKKSKEDKTICFECKKCKKKLIKSGMRQVKKFCSDECRRAWWKENDKEYNRKAYYSLNCQYCGINFMSYGNRNRKYCSHNCYINYRFKGEKIDDSGAI